MEKNEILFIVEKSEEFLDDFLGVHGVSGRGFEKRQNQTMENGRPGFTISFEKTNIGQRDSEMFPDKGRGFLGGNGIMGEI